MHWRNEKCILNISWKA